MPDRCVTYRKQLEAKGENVAPVGVDEAVSLVKKMASVKSDRTYKNGRRRKSKDHTVDIVLHLGIDPKQADQMLRGAISLPKGLGKSRSVIAFCDAATAEAANCRCTVRPVEIDGEPQAVTMDVRNVRINFVVEDGMVFEF